MNENEILLSEENSEEYIDFDELESKLEAELDEQLSDFNLTKEEKKKIGNPVSIANALKDTVWEQFISQLGVTAGEDFIKENKGMKLDLSNDAHIQTAENFEKGKIATHNDAIDYQKRYDDWTNNFQKDENGAIKTKYDPRSGQDKKVLKSDSRAKFDKDRPMGSKTVNYDHTVSAAEIMRDPEANAHLSVDEQIKFANSEKNLNPIDAEANKSKSDLKMDEWLNSEKNGETPAERFNIDEEQLKQKDKEAREEYEKIKKEGEKRSVKTGRKSQAKEAFKIGGKALRAAIMALLADMVKDVMSNLIRWLKNGQKNLKSFFNTIKIAVKNFVSNLKKHIVNAGGAFLSAVETAVLGPVASIINKIFMLLKQGFKSLKEAVLYIRNPENRKKSFGVMLCEIGKIVISGLTVTGGILLGEVIELSLSAIPLFNFPIPLIGSLANILGMLLGGLISGLIGALAIMFIDRIIQKRHKAEITKSLAEKGSRIINTQLNLISVKQEKFLQTKTHAADAINERHKEASKAIRNCVDNIFNSEEYNIDDKLDEIDAMLNEIDN
ncbi:MAG: AI-2E family transporter [Ruminococcus sp.]